MELRLEAIGHAYGSLEVLRGIDLLAEDGKILCLVGPSGCGKSTVLRIAGGLEKPQQGRVWQIGEPPASSLNPITFVFQDFALLPWRTVAANISLVLEDHKLGAERIATIVGDVLERTRLAEFHAALPRQLSGGMKQRVAIARALAVDPAVMLMDEPLSALDAQTRELLLDDLVGLWSRRPFTGIYVTHNLSEAVRIGHRVAVLSRRPGRVRELVEIERPLPERRDDDPDLVAIRQRLWQLMRDEARAADAELADV